MVKLIILITIFMATAIRAEEHISTNGHYDTTQIKIDNKCFESKGCIKFHYDDKHGARCDGKYIKGIDCDENRSYLIDVGKGSQVDLDNNGFQISN